MTKIKTPGTTIGNLSDEMPSELGELIASDGTTPLAVIGDENTGKVFRPSDLRKLMIESNNGDAKEVEKIDPFRFRKERGLTNPLIRYRITATRAGKNPLAITDEIEACDKSEAISKLLAKHKIEQSHEFRFETFVLEE
jgi:hypothetical protein